MSTVQKQELSVFNDHSVLSNELFKEDSHHLMMISDKQATSSSWLVNALIETLVYGSPNSLNGASNSTSSRPTGRGIIVASFLNNSTYFTNSLGKLKIPASHYTLLELSADLVQKNFGKPADTILENLTKQFASMRGATIILEKPEILMSLFKISSDDLQLKLINPLMRRCSLLIMITSTENFDNDMPENFGKDTVECVRFTTSSFHKAIAVLSVKPLDTGKANDVTGTLTITRGGALLESSIAIVENEYLYHTLKDSTTLFYR